jgi:hypothetical protein
MGVWPGPRDPASEAGVLEVRRRWARIQRKAKRAAELARTNLVLLLRHEATGVEFDVSFAWTSFEHEAIAASTVAAFGTVNAPMAQPEDLIVFKSIAGRGRDVDDVIALLTLYPDIDLERARARVRELAFAAEAPELVVGLETAIIAAERARPVLKQVRTTKSRAARTSKPPKKRRASQGRKARS